MEENGVLAVCGYEIEKICSFYSLPVGTFVKAIFCAPSHFHMVMLCAKIECKCENRKCLAFPVLI